MRFRDSDGGLVARQSTPRTRLRALNATTGLGLSYFRRMSGNAVVVKLPKGLNYADVASIAEELSLQADVEFAVPDFLVKPHLVPNDPLFFQQWHYQNSDGGIRLPSAWNITTGSSNVVVGVLDTGILPHNDLAGRVLPGYDFITDVNIANDGDGRDSDPTDPGDWVTVIESSTPGGPFDGCPASESSWHGTHVAGTIGASTNNSVGVSGISWGAKILPVRVLGKCGGFLSDIVDGIRWAAGFPVPGVPNNPRPAQIINLSLGATSSCPIVWQEAINEIIASGRIILTSAGNSNMDVSTATPANCNGVIVVAATAFGGSKAFYTNFGARVTVSAPGGQQLVRNDLTGILSTADLGRTVPTELGFRFLQGTSMAVAHASGVVSLMLSVNPGLSPMQVRQKLSDTAQPFPNLIGGCNRFTCGAGIVDAYAAVRAALFTGKSVDYYPFAINQLLGLDSVLIVTNIEDRINTVDVCTVRQEFSAERCIVGIKLGPYDMRPISMTELNIVNTVAQILVLHATDSLSTSSQLVVFDTSGHGFTIIDPLSLPKI